MLPLWCGLAAAAPSGAELARDAERLGVLGSVLYIAAHPDDENTRLLSYLVGERGYQTTYLSLTRGGGGQNLVGDEMSELLGVVRTGELLAARRIDGAEQRFTRARDFGYSKSADEAFANWGHEEVLNDVVRVIREVQPDVVITRFGPGDKTHGHHVASAILAAEAAEKAADPAYLTNGQTPWTVDRILRNESHWRIKPDTDTSGWLTLNVGGFDAARGVSWGEVAAASRTMHKSQGFGSAPSVGEQIEYLSGVAGAVPAIGKDPFSGLDTSWTRLEDTKTVRKALKKLAFDPMKPSASLPKLAKVHRAVAALDDSVWRTRKLADIEQLMVDAAGLWATAHTDVASVSRAATFSVDVQIEPRAAEVTVHGASIFGMPVSPGDNQIQTPVSPVWTRPHWLVEPSGDTLYTLEEGPERTAPDTPAAVQLELDITVAGIRMNLMRPVQHAWTDRVHGQLTHDLEVLPAVTATFSERTHLAPQGTPFNTRLTVRGDHVDREGTLTFQVPEGTTVSPEVTHILFGGDDHDVTVELTITPGSTPGSILPILETEGTEVDEVFAKDVLDFPHLDRRTVLRPSTLHVVPVEIDRGGTDRVGYLEGSGDLIPETLEDLGYTVVPLDLDAVSQGLPDDLSTIVVGIRAFNVHARLRELQPALYGWVARGGRLIVQYQTSSSYRPLDIGPKSLTLRRGRVTDQRATITPLDPADPVLNTPNELTAADFDGWVQERGLYFAETWDPAYRPVFEMNDSGEKPQQGSLLIAKHGEGTFVYTGISFFRQFPAGVPGAARLFANLLAIEAP